jgi:hypothetical protein
MITVSADKYVELGRWLEGSRISFMFVDDGSVGDNETGRIKELKTGLRQLAKSCEELGLTRAQELVSHAYNDLPQSRREFELLLRAVMTHISKTVFLFIPEHISKYYELALQSAITTNFPLASKELVWAGNSIAVGLYTAAVFHSMRAAEIGMRVLGDTIGVSFPDKPIELAEWQNILDQADSKIVAMKNWVFRKSGG